MKGNPNPSPATRFGTDRQPDKRGRQKGDRDRLSRKYLFELAEHFDAHGKTAIKRVYEEDPAKYLAAVAGVVPKEIELIRPLDGMSDEELLGAIHALTDALRSQAPPQDDQPTLTVN